MNVTLNEIIQESREELTLKIQHLTKESDHMKLRIRELEDLQ